MRTRSVWLPAALIYAALSLLMVSPALAPGKTLSPSDLLWAATPWKANPPPGVPGFGSNRELSDQVYVFQPFLQHTRRELPHVPLWNPSLMGGRPYLANAQSAVFSPFSAPAYVLPFWRSLAVIAALKLFMAALGTFLLASALRIGFGGALLAGLVYGFSFWFVAWLGWPTTSVWAFLPWLWLLADRIVRRPDVLSVAGLGAVTCLQYLGGHPQSSFHVLVFTVAFFGLRLAGRGRAGLPAGTLGRRVAAFAGGLVLGTALAAITLLPLLEFLHRSADSSSRGYFATLFAPKRYLLTAFLHDYWGRTTRTSIDAPLNPILVEHQFYAGALPLMLAPAALLLRRSLARIGVAAIGAVALATSVGLTPLDSLVRALPGFDVTQNSRLAIVYFLSLALLAGWALHDLSERRPVRRSRRTVLTVSAAVLAVPIVWMALLGTLTLRPLGHALGVAWGFASPPRPAAGVTASELGGIRGEIRLASLLEWLLPASGGLALVALRLRRLIGPTPFAALAVLLVAADLFKAGVGFNPAIPERNAVQPLTPALRYLRERRPARFTGLTPRNRLGLVNTMPPDIAMRYGLFDARGYDFPVERRYERLWRENVGVPPCSYEFCTSSALASPRALRALSVLGVADLVQDPGDAPLRVPGLRLAYRGADARVYANRRALPRAFLVGRQQVVDGDSAALAAVVSPSFRGRSVAVTDKPLPGLSPGGGARRERAPGTARLESYGAEHVRVRTASRRPSILVLTDVWYPGWKATVDGGPVSVRRVDYLLRGVPVPAGTHLVALRYKPDSWRAGWIVSALALALLLSTLLLRRARRPWRRRARASPGVGSARG
jgi:hypothetical protein